MKKLGAAGDTIVEVLLAIAVAGFALAGAFTLARGSLNQGRSAQEHTEALKVAESQVELLRASTNISTTTVFNGGNDFCLDNSLNRLDMGGSGHAASNPDADNFSQYNGQCIKNSVGASGSGGFYHSSINYSGAPNDVFTIRVYWDSVNKSGRDSVTLYYKLHKIT